METEKRLCTLSARTTQPVKEAVRAEAKERRWSESELVHSILCSHFGWDPDAGGPTGPEGSALGQEAEPLPAA